MRSSLLEILADPHSHSSLELERAESRNGTIVSGVLRGEDGSAYPIEGGIPRFVEIADSDQRQTATSFGFKWHQRHSYDSPGFREFATRWLVERYGFESQEAMRRYFTGQRLVLDAGCGSGFSTSLWMDADWPEAGDAQWVGLDISSAIDVARERLGEGQGRHYVQGDVSQLPFRPGTFSAAISEGVLHHTPSTEQALQSLASALEPGGEAMFYVYRRKGSVREFADDHIRSALSGLPPEEAWEKLRPLTKLGQSLAELDATVEIEEPIEYLGIPAGTYSVQRLVYWHFVKLFWNESLSFEENNHVNFDWYHPRYAHRQTEDDVRRWCRDAGLEITHFDVQESGFTVRATKD
jgi:arsenite methyltransferase